MTRISRFKLRNEELEELVDHFTYLISSLTSKSEIENFFTEFLTREEKLMLAKRLVLFMMIQKSYSPTTIQSTLHISYETVRTYTNQFTNKNAIFKKTIQQLIKREKSKEFWKKVDTMLRPVGIILHAKTDMKSRAKLASGDFS